MGVGNEITGSENGGGGFGEQAVTVTWMGALPRVQAADGGKWMESINSAEVDVMG